jgi:hypothetical protein
MRAAVRRRRQEARERAAQHAATARAAQVEAAARRSDEEGGGSNDELVFPKGDVMLASDHDSGGGGGGGSGGSRRQRHEARKQADTRRALAAARVPRCDCGLSAGAVGHLVASGALAEAPPLTPEALAAAGLSADATGASGLGGGFLSADSLRALPGKCVAVAGDRLLSVACPHATPADTVAFATSADGPLPAARSAPGFFFELTLSGQAGTGAGGTDGGAGDETGAGTAKHRSSGVGGGWAALRGDWDQYEAAVVAAAEDEDLPTINMYFCQVCDDAEAAGNELGWVAPWLHAKQGHTAAAEKTVAAESPKKVAGPAGPTPPVLPEKGAAAAGAPPPPVPPWPPSLEAPSDQDLGSWLERYVPKYCRRRLARVS